MKHISVKWRYLQDAITNQEVWLRKVENETQCRRRLERDSESASAKEHVDHTENRAVGNFMHSESHELMGEQKSTWSVNPSTGHTNIMDCRENWHKKVAMDCRENWHKKIVMDCRENWHKKVVMDCRENWHQKKLAQEGRDGLPRKLAQEDRDGLPRKLAQEDYKRLLRKLEEHRDALPREFVKLNAKSPGRQSKCWEQEHRDGLIVLNTRRISSESEERTCRDCRENLKNIVRYCRDHLKSTARG